MPPLGTSDFRTGVIYGAQRQWPKVYPTVDIAPLCKMPDGATETLITYVLLGKKPGETLWRFVGGFVDPTDESYEEAALREMREETHIAYDLGMFAKYHPKYLGSFRVNDWRYTGRDRIITSFFCLNIFGGDMESAKAGDDLAEIKWLPLDKDILSIINPLHRELMITLLTDQDVDF